MTRSRALIGFSARYPLHAVLFTAYCCLFLKLEYRCLLLEPRLEVLRLVLAVRIRPPPQRYQDIYHLAEPNQREQEGILGAGLSGLVVTAHQSLQGNLDFHLRIQADGRHIFDGGDSVVRMRSQGFGGHGFSSLWLPYAY